MSGDAERLGGAHCLACRRLSLGYVFSNALSGCKSNKLLEPVQMNSRTEFFSVVVKMAFHKEQAAQGVMFVPF